MLWLALPCRVTVGIRLLSATRMVVEATSTSKLAATTAGIFLDGERGRVVAAVRQIAIHGVGRFQWPGRIADHLGVGRLADGEIDFGGVQIGKAAAEPRLGLRGIGRGDVAGLETSLGDREGFAQERDIGALRFDQRLVGQHVGIGGDGVEQHALADIAQRLAAGLHLQFRDADAVGGLEAVEQRLRHRHADDPGFQVGRLHGVIGQQIAHRLQPAAQAGDDLRPIAGQRLRHVLVGGALPRPFGIELRIGLIGLGQRLGQAFRPGRRGAGKADASGDAKADARPKHAPSLVANSNGTPNHVIPQQTPAVRPRRRLRHVYLFRGGAATGKPRAQKSVQFRRSAVAGSSQTNIGRKYAIAAGGRRPIPDAGFPNCFRASP